MRRPFFAMATWLLANLSVGAQAPARTPPVFRSATRLVQFTVVVDGPRGPAATLSKDAFIVTDNGQPQPISLFQFTDTRQWHATEPLPQPPGQFSNVPTAGAREAPNVAVILLDCLGSTQRMSIGMQGLGSWAVGHACQYGRYHLEKFVSAVGPNDRVAIFGLNRRLRLLSDFTSNRDQLLAALKNYKTTEIPALVAPSGSLGGLSSVNGDFAGLVDAADVSFGRFTALSRRTATIATLRIIANYLAQVPGRISLIWVTATPMVGGADVVAALANDRIAVYPVDARGLVAGGLGTRIGTNLPGLADLLDIADATGGFAYINRNDLETGAYRAMEDSAESYTLGFYVGDQVLDNKFHQLRVRLQPHGLHARYPHGYWAFTENVVPAVNPVAVALASPVQSDVIPLRATLAPAAHGGVAVHANFRVLESDFHRVGPNFEGDFLVGVAGESSTGALIQPQFNGVKLTLSPGQYAGDLQTGLPLNQSWTPVPGAVNLRVVVEDLATGAVGSLIIPLHPAH